MASFKCEGESGHEKPGRKRLLSLLRPYAKCVGDKDTHSKREIATTDWDE